MVFLEDSVIVKRPIYKFSERPSERLVKFYIIKENEEIDGYKKVDTYLSEQKFNANLENLFKNKKNNSDKD